MEFNISDRVRIKAYEDLPEEGKHKGLSKHAGRDGTIVDVMWSNARECYLYKMLFDDCDSPSRTEFPEGSFDLIPELEQPTYTIEFEYAENLTIARLYEIRGEEKVEVAKGHGHVFHDGALGIAQSASYACKKLWFSMTRGDAE